MEIKVYLSSENPESKTTQKLLKKFKEFDVTMVKAGNTDFENFISCVNSCPRNKFCFWIKGNSVTTADTENIRNYLSERLDEKWDLLYLCKWMDQCDRYTDYNRSDTGFFTVRSLSPNGVQALIVSPTGKEKLQKLRIKDERGLLDHIKEEKLVAYSSVPNIFEISGSEVEPIKYFHCQTVYPSTKPDLNEGQVVSNLITEINSIAPAKPDLTVSTPKTDTTLYQRFNSMDFMFFVKIFYVVLILMVLIDIGIKIYREKNNNKVKNE